MQTLSNPPLDKLTMKHYIKRLFCHLYSSQNKDHKPWGEKDLYFKGELLENNRFIILDKKINITPENT